MNTQVIIQAERTGYSTEQIKHTLTVRELIEVLENFDENAKIYLSHDNGYTFGGITERNIDEETVDEDYCE